MQSNTDSVIGSSGEAVVQGFLGDLSQLSERIGAPAIPAISSKDGGLDLKTAAITDAESLGRFLRDYRQQILGAVELPAIVEASQRVHEGALKELMALDGRISESQLGDFASASRWVGMCHARSLLGMKDHRVVQRYCVSVTEKRAQGWHSVVYGVILAAFSIPLRQGLVRYAERINRSFIESVSGGIALESEALTKLSADFQAELPGLVEAALGAEAQAGVVRLV